MVTRVPPNPCRCTLKPVLSYLETRAPYLQTRAGVP
jgi:hypothetical protein